jgi:hypothetical protein
MQPIKGLLRYYLYIIIYYKRNTLYFTPLSHASLPLKLTRNLITLIKHISKDNSITSGIASGSVN